ncbi:MAG: response regulator [Nitrospira sp.]
MNGYGKRVLLVEGDKDQRGLLSSVLESSGYSVQVVGTGRDALVEMKRRQFDALVTLPYIDGFQLVLLGRLVWPETPMILLLNDDTNLFQMAEQKGAFGCLHKPYDASKLLQLLGAAIESAGGQRSHTLESVPPAGC